MSQQFKDLLEK